MDQTKAIADLVQENAAAMAKLIEASRAGDVSAIRSLIYALKVESEALCRAMVEWTMTLANLEGDEQTANAVRLAKAQWPDMFQTPGIAELNADVEALGPPN